MEAVKISQGRMVLRKRMMLHDTLQFARNGQTIHVINVICQQSRKLFDAAQLPAGAHV
jgi:hypothetical protein